MTLLALFLFVLVVSAGSSLALRFFKKKPYKTWILAVHGAVAWTGLVVLLLNMAIQHNHNLFIVGAFVVLMLNFLLGLFMLTLYMLKKPKPRWVIVLHILMGGSGFVLLLLGVIADF